MSWHSVRLQPSLQQREAVMCVLRNLDTQGIHEDGEAIVAWYSEEVSETHIRHALESAGFSGPLEFAVAETVDWSEKWKEKLRVQRVGRVTVTPPWLASNQARSDIQIVIDPGMAFGTGDHATTRCALHLLQRIVRSGDRVADLGTGSAVLSIAAALLGATRVVAIELDHDAIGNAAENIARNGVADSITLFESDAAIMLPLVSPFEVVVANIVSSVLVEVLPAVQGALVTGGQVVLSGILSQERDEFVNHLGMHKWQVVDEVSEEGWCALALIVH